MTTVASKISFYKFACLLEKLNRINGEAKKKNLLKLFVKQWREFEIKLRSSGTGDQNDSFFPALRFLLPQLDRDREAYGIKEHTLAKLFIKIFGLGPKSPSALNLINYKSPKSGKNDLAGNDFATVAYHILKDRCPEKGTLSISDINRELDSVALGHAGKNQDKVDKSLLRLVKNVSSQELKWLIRIILKEMKIGMGQRSIFHCYHLDGEEVYNVKMSLEKVCLTLRDPQIRLHEIEISLFSPFRPMLAQRSSPDDVETSMKGQPYFIEVKFDGERMQLHMSDGNFKYFSRGGMEYTHTYGENCNQGNFTPHISKQFHSSICSCILDGEMVGYNPEDDTIGSKGENFDIKSSHIEKYQPMYVVFDILLLNGKVMANVPLRVRREAMIGVFSELKGRIVVSKVVEKRTNLDCIEVLNEAIDKREEGIMIKDPESVYKPNSRNKGGWLKIKPEYIIGHSNDLDLIVVGGYFGDRSPMVTHFLCAVAVDPDEGENPLEFHTFTKVGTGYSIKELTEINQKLSNDWIPFKKSSPPDWLKFPNGYRQKPDVVLRNPSKSIVFQIKAAEIIQSDQYKTGTTLRFPRVVKVRYDKPWYDCITLQQIEELKKKFDGKLTGTYVGPGQSKVKVGSKRRSSIQLKPAVDKRFKGIEEENVEKTSALFSNKEICVMTGDGRMEKPQLEELVVKNGGSISQNSSNDTFCIIAGKLTLKVKNVIKIGNKDVIRSDWLVRCDGSQQLLPWLPMDVIHATPKTKQDLANNYCLYGDGFYDDTTEETLRMVFDRMNMDELISNKQIVGLESKYFNGDDDDDIFGLFRSYKAFFHPAHVTTLPSVLFKLHGGDRASNSIDDEINIIIKNHEVSGDDDVPLFQSEQRLISDQWIIDSIQSRRILNIGKYSNKSRVGI